MYASRKIYASTAAIALTTLFFSTPSFAQEANAVAQRIKDTFAAQGVEIGWSSATGTGSQIVLDGVTYGAPGVQDKFTIGKVTLDNVAEASGGYTIGTMTFPAFSVTQDGMTFEMTAATMSGVRLPPPGATDFISSMMLYDSGQIDRMTVKMGDKQVASLENTHFAMTPPSSGLMTFSGAVDKISADLTAIPDPRTQATVQALGYQQITGNMQMAGSWNANDGRMEFSKYDIAVDNAGKLGMTFDIGGYTAEFLKAMQDISKQMSATAGGPDQNAQNMAMIGLMQQLVFNGASIRFEDASLTNKVLNFVALQQGADPAQLKEQTKTIIPFLLASSPLKDEALKKSIADAVAAYMDDPKSLTIRAKPATPQPFAAIAAQSQVDPAALTSTLGVSVTAND